MPIAITGDGNQGRRLSHISDDASEMGTELTYGNCLCRNSWVLSEGDCDGPATVFHGCGMVSPCNGKAHRGMTWCLIDANIACGKDKAGPNWDWCLPRAFLESHYNSSSLLVTTASPLLSYFPPIPRHSRAI